LEIAMRLLPALVAALIAVCAAPGFAAPAELPPSRYKQGGIEIYAPSEAELALAAALVSRSVRNFRTRFGSAPKITVLLFSSNEELRRFDPAAFGGDGGAVLAWLSPFSNVSRFVSVPAMDGLVVTQDAAGPGLKVAGRMTEGPATLALAAGDRILEVNGRSVADVRNFLTQYVPIRTGQRVTLKLLRGAGQVNLAFEKPAMGSSEELPGEIIAHEAGHALLNAYVDAHLAGRALPAPRRSTYGHSSIPDWLDEAVAQLVEGDEPSKGSERRRRLNEIGSGKLALQRLLAMDHPSIAARSGATDAERRSVSQVETSGGADAFYAQSVELLRMLIVLEGKEFLPRLVQGLAEGRQMDEILAAARRAPRSAAELASLFGQWMKNGIILCEGATCQKLT
jgi:hypothetical protein